LKKENSVRGEVSRISLEGSSSQGGASRNTATGYKRVKVLWEGERVHSGKDRDGPSHGGKSAKDPGRGVKS